jgi:Haem-NO-binding
MYGLVNQAIEDLIRKNHGDQVWDAVKHKAGVDVEAFVSMEAYPDAVSYGLVGAASEVLGTPAAQLLEAFGEHWTLYTAQKGYGDLLRTGGSTFKGFMQNLHNLHTHVALSFPHLRPPSFWCTDVTDGTMTLHYQSTREGLGPMVVGLVRGLGRMFATEVTITPTRSRTDGADHDEFLVTFAPQSST